MALDRWTPEAMNPSYPAGSVLFDITLPPGAIRSYHVMIIRDGMTRTSSDGVVELPISDMTGRTTLIRWPDQDSWHSLHPDCFIGYFPELTAEETREALEELWSLRSDPKATGGEFYTLASHGVWQEDPNASGNDLPGIRCSCASLIEYCYEQIARKVDLVNADRVPKVTAEELWNLVGDGGPFGPVIARIMRGLGLEGEGPWAVLLPAYQMCAFADSLDNLSNYQPALNHHPYP